MHIALDAREAFSDRRTGKGVWTLKVLEKLCERQDVRVTALSGVSSLPPSLEGRVTHVRLGQGLRWHWQCRTWLNALRPDAYLSTTSYLLPAWLHPKVPVVTVVHDLIAFRPEPHDRKAVFIERVSLASALRNSKRVLCLSQSTADDVHARFSALTTGKTDVVYAGPTLKVPPPTAASRGILCIATLCPRKNQLGLLAAYEKLPSSLRAEHPLTFIGGRGWHDEPVLEAIRSVPEAAWLGYATDAECAQRLRDCAVFAFPSFYEGFGLPVLDAFAAGVPVLTSQAGSLAEVAGQAAWLVDPADTEAMTRGLEALLSSEALRTELREKGLKQAQKFSWQDTAERIMRSLHSLS